MAIVYGTSRFFLAPGAQAGFITSFANKAYRGPIVCSSVADGLRQRVATSPVDPEFIERNPDGFTSKCDYHFVANNFNAFGVTVRFHLLTD